jgi:hypothetical protein
MNSNFQLAKENFDKGIINFNNELYLEAENFFDLSLKFIPDRVTTLSNLLICKIKLKKIQMPKSPPSVYYNKKQWKGWPDFLGTKKRALEEDNK